MTYYPTLDEDLQRAKEILERGQPTAEGLEGIDSPVILSLQGGTIYGGDVFAAYKLLESFVAHITSHFRPDHNGECLNCDEPEDGHGLHDQLLRAQTHVAQLRAEVVDLQRWKDAVSDACITDWIFTREHEKNPRLAVNDLLAWQQQITLDPAVSKEAAELHERIAYLGTRVDLAEGLNRQHEQTIEELQAAVTGAEILVGVNLQTIAKQQEALTAMTGRNVQLLAEQMQFYGLFSDYDDPCESYLQAQAIWNDMKRREGIERAETWRLRVLVNAVGEDVCKLALRQQQILRTSPARYQDPPEGQD